MASRKIQKSRSGSYLISLPKSWAEEADLKKGDRVKIRKEEDGSLSLLVSEERSKINHKLVLEDFKSVHSLQDTIKACYMQGAETISVVSEDGTITEVKEKLRPIVLDLIGSEIYKDRPDKIVFRVLVDPTKFSMQNLIERVHSLISSVFQHALDALKSNNPEIASDSSQRGEDAKRLYRLMIRETKLANIDKEIASAIGIENKGEILVFTIAARGLSRMAHHTVEFASLISEFCEKLSQEDIQLVLEMSNTVQEMVDKSIKSLIEKKYQAGSRGSGPNERD
ncbi:hypothetical protein AKJ50_00440 [candidate division MSBL1 archaeon SCGC-AAA382A13]|uniref:SpoVT-AbrB domain-containing protein n=1 Tax=candidate division MSBL1 archaeon SCGC-AAA382A13 TaxID=1698279 RepID=A0A133VGR8_9EURY|nr:hypothetical protein AKJ50_00440 [candidate division MSBL1 archaeon SCGC-AAA382A13]